MPLQDGLKNKSQFGVATLVRQTAIVSNAFTRRNTIQIQQDRDDDQKSVEIEVSPIQKNQQKCLRLITSRPVLIAVVLLCIADCLLVISELILDIHYMKAVVETYDSYASSNPRHSCDVSSSDDTNNVTDDENDDWQFSPHDEHRDDEHLAHVFHFVSIAILATLAVETLVKILCFGKEFLKKKLEVFDAIVVYASFIVDLVLIKGITAKPIAESAFILSFLLPWRVVRVVNSLLVAMLAKEHLKLVLVYTTKRRLEKEMDETLADLHVTRRQLHILKAMCVSHGDDEWNINNKLSAIGQPSTVPLDELYLFKQQQQTKKKLRKKMENRSSGGQSDMLARSKRTYSTNEYLGSIIENDNSGFEDDGDNEYIEDSKQQDQLSDRLSEISTTSHISDVPGGDILNDLADDQ